MATIDTAPDESMIEHDRIIRKRMIDPEDEILWRDVRNAVRQVEKNSERQITIEKAGYKATIVKASDSILISLEVQEPDPPKLILPH